MLVFKETHFQNYLIGRFPVLTHSFPMHPFSTSWKHQKTLRFPDVFRGQRKSILESNGLNYSTDEFFHTSKVGIYAKNSRRLAKEKLIFDYVMRISKCSLWSVCGEIHCLLSCRGNHLPFPWKLKFLFTSSTTTLLLYRIWTPPRQRKNKKK